MNPAKRRFAVAFAGRLGTGLLALAAVVSFGRPAHAFGQEIADFDYENLSFRGIGFEVGAMFPTRVENTASYRVMLDLGYLGPGVRLVPSFTYWSSDFSRSEVRELEERVAGLVSRETGAPRPVVDLGTIEWTDYSLGLDAHVVWSVPFDALTFAGLGVSAHILDGSGAAIRNTFVEDLLDQISAGINVHAGVEYPLTDRFRLRTQGKYEVIEDMQFFEWSFGGRILWGQLVPGEERRR